MFRHCRLPPFPLAIFVVRAAAIDKAALVIMPRFHGSTVRADGAGQKGRKSLFMNTANYGKQSVPTNALSDIGLALLLEIHWAAQWLHVFQTSDRGESWRDIRRSRWVSI